jgi:hypothetical protein
MLPSVIQGIARKTDIIQFMAPSGILQAVFRGATPPATGQKKNPEARIQKCMLSEQEVP